MGREILAKLGLTLIQQQTYKAKKSLKKNENDIEQNYTKWNLQKIPTPF